MSLQVQAARGLKWQGVEIAGRQVLSLVVFTTLARLLDPSAFGLMSLVAVYLAFVSMFVDQGIGTALVQRQELDEQHLNAAFWFNVGCAILFCAATIALAEPAALFFNEPKLVRLLRWASLSLVINAAGAVHGALFFRAMDFRRPTMRTLVANVSGGAVGIGMAMGGLGVWALIGQQLTASVAGTCFLWCASTWRPSWTFSLPHLRQLMAMSGSVFATSLLWFFSSRTDQMVIGSMLGASTLGHYAVAARLSDLAKTVVYQPLGAVALPTLSRLQDDRARLDSAIRQAMSMSAIVSTPCLLGLSVIASDLIPLLLGPQWRPAAVLLQVLALYILVNGLQDIAHYAILATGGPGAFVAVALLHAIGVVIACAIGVRFGVLGVAVGLLVNSVVMTIPRLYALRRRVGTSLVDYYRPCVVPAVAGALMYLVVLVVRAGLALPEGWIRLALLILCGAATYLGCVFAFDRSGLQRLARMTASALGGDPRPVGTT